MTRYILIDNDCGFVWGEAEAANAIEACRKVDADLGAYDTMRRYQEVYSFDGASGYHVYEAPADFQKITDGQDGEQIDAVMGLDCVALVAIRDDLDFDDE